MFQSRNRVSSLFKANRSLLMWTVISRFNLVIEYLLFSSRSQERLERLQALRFQSRNRVSSLFKNMGDILRYRRCLVVSIS